MATATELLQDFNAGRIVTLYTLDATSIDGTTLFHFTDSTSTDGNAIVFDGVVYVPIPIEVSGFEKDSNAAPPRPKMKVGNAAGTLSALLQEFGDLVGARLTRIKTFERFLDAGEEPDPDQTFGTEIYHISRKTEQNKVYVEFELATPMDQQNVRLPGRKQFRRHCSRVYRKFNAAANEFDYTHATCPYVGETSFDQNGVVTSPENDVCAHHADACDLRFPGALPMHAFPGMNRVR